MHTQPPLVIDRSTPFSTGITASIVGLIGMGGGVFAFRRWGSTDELAELFGVVAFAGGVSFLIGLSMLLWRSQVVLDRDAGTGLEWNGVLVPMRRSAFRLDEVRHVAFSRSHFRTRHASHTVYAARLEGPAKAIVLISDTNESPVKQAADATARYLGVPIIDETPERL